MNPVLLLHFRKRIAPVPAHGWVALAGLRHSGLLVCEWSGQGLDACFVRRSCVLTRLPLAVVMRQRLHCMRSLHAASAYLVLQNYALGKLGVAELCFGEARSHALVI